MVGIDVGAVVRTTAINPSKPFTRVADIFDLYVGEDQSPLGEVTLLEGPRPGCPRRVTYVRILKRC
jgi:hypothetical protein